MGKLFPDSEMNIRSPIYNVLFPFSFFEKNSFERGILESWKEMKVYFGKPSSKTCIYTNRKFQTLFSLHFRRHLDGGGGVQGPRPGDEQHGISLNNAENNYSFISIFQFASLVREVAAPDVGRMGIEILSFTIKDVYDNVTYLASLGESHSTLVSH